MTLRDDIIPHHVSWAEVHRDTKLLVRQLISKGPWEGIVALTRGGLFPAAILAREMEIRVVDTLCISTYDEQLKGSINVLKIPERATAVDGEGWLLVDDLVDTGTTAKKAREILPKSHFATVYAKPQGKPTTDNFVSEVPQDVWVFFPWDTEPQYIAPLVGS
ncbi:MAG TPA: xanthine phosphoribosyltransferase [Rhodospirillales bacterium]|nr:xanthine phosphoribosyltransferase [Rhodospirillales bacterium]|tara:strand:- start:270 stop:755 length:486 start_codon:yes stop_codon:yes gene_type:complete